MKTNAEIMREYFAAELRLLRDGAQEFSKRYPEQAGMLNLNAAQDHDPYIERLLEGVAYLTAQIRQRIDDDIPDLCETLLQQLAPQFLQHFPSATILQFQPSVGKLQKTYVIEKNTSAATELIGDPNKKISCGFRTCQTIKVNPLRISDVNVSPHTMGGSVIKISLQLDNISQQSKLDLSELSLYLHAEPALALQLHYALTNGVSRVQVMFPEQTRQFAVELGGQNCLKAFELNWDNVLLPVAQQNFLGFQLLQEYFSFRKKFLFVTLHGLDKMNFPSPCQKIDIIIYTKITFAKEYQVTKDNFQLHCVPAINLFCTSAEPIKYFPTRYEYPIVTDNRQTHTPVLYGVDKVIGIEDNTGKRCEYFAMTSFSYRKQQSGYFHTQQRNIGALYPTTFLMLGGIKENCSCTLSCVITVSNGHYPRRYLGENSLLQAKQSLPNFISVRNITRPSAMLLPQQRENFRWRLLSYLSLNYQVLTELSNFKELLSNHDWTEQQDNEGRINGIQEITVQTIRKIHRGALFNGMQFTITVQEENYLSVADIHLFGMVIHQFLQMSSNFNIFIETRFVCQPSQQEFVWTSLI
jgi:type VI secretion system protein ImpG